MLWMCLAGKSAKVRQALGVKIFCFAEIRNWRIDCSSRPDEGRSLAVTNAARDAVDADSAGATGDTQGGWRIEPTPVGLSQCAGRPTL